MAPPPSRTGMAAASTASDTASGRRREADMAAGVAAAGFCCAFRSGVFAAPAFSSNLTLPLRVLIAL